MPLLAGELLSPLGQRLAAAGFPSRLQTWMFWKDPPMTALPLWVAAAWIALHASALTAALMTRLAAGSRLEAASQLGCFGTMMGVGLAAWISHQMKSGLWLLSSVELVAIVLIAVVDLRRSSEPSWAVSHRPNREAN
jgi:hypothetical protein